MANLLTISDAALLERIRSIETTPQVQAGDYVCQWPSAAYWSTPLQPGTGAFCAQREHMRPDLHIPEQVKRDYTSDLSCIAADTKPPPRGSSHMRTDPGRSAHNLDAYGRHGCAGRCQEHAPWSEPLARCIDNGLGAATSAIAEVDQKHMGVNQSIVSLTTGVEAATVAIAEMDNKHMGVEQSIGSLTVGLEVATVAIAELGASQNQIGQQLSEVMREGNDRHDSLTMGLDAATSAIAKLSLRHTA